MNDFIREAKKLWPFKEYKFNEEDILEYLFMENLNIYSVLEQLTTLTNKYKLLKFNSSQSHVSVNALSLFNPSTNNLSNSNNNTLNNITTAFSILPIDVFTPIKESFLNDRLFNHIMGKLFITCLDKFFKSKMLFEDMEIMHKKKLNYKYL